MRTVLAALVLTCCTYAHVQGVGTFVGGNDLYEACKDDASQFCVGYLMGAADVASNTVVATTLCIPHEATAGRLRSVLMRYLDEHPEQREEPAYRVVLLALLDAFPCERVP
jgi:hypothetical protein